MSAVLLRDDAEELVGRAANLTETGKRTAAQKPRLFGMRLACKVHSDRAENDKRTAAERAFEVDAFLADKESQWARIVPMSERGRR